LQLRLKLGFRQISLNSILLFPVRVHDQNCRRPGYVEAVKPGGVFLYVRLNRYKMRANEGRDIIVRVRLGFQPSASPSSGRGTEINQ
jgi:hypothetical protein